MQEGTRELTASHNKSMLEVSNGASDCGRVLWIVRCYIFRHMTERIGIICGDYWRRRLRFFT